MEQCNEIGRRIKSLREKKGLTQQQLANELHVKRETVNLWENGLRDLKTGYTVALADFFEVDCDYLLRGISANRADIHKATGLSEDSISCLEIMQEHYPVAFYIVDHIFTDIEAMSEITDFLLSSSGYHIKAEKLRSEASEVYKNIKQNEDKKATFKEHAKLIKEAEDADEISDYFVYKSLKRFESSIKHVMEYVKVTLHEKDEKDE